MTKTTADAGRTAFTEADFNGWRFDRDAMHFNGGKVFFGHGHRCVDQPRLLVIDKYFKTDRSTKRSYLIDGKSPYETLPEALAALSSDPELTGDELALLALIPLDCWHKPVRRAPFLPLVDMGFAKWHKAADGIYIGLTDAGRAALAAAKGPDSE